MNTNRNIAVTAAVVAHIASLLPKIEFNEAWRDEEGGYDKLELSSDALPEGVVHAATDTDGRILLIVKHQDQLHALYQTTDRGMLLYAGDDQELCEVMEITGPEVTVYSLMLFFGLFGPPEATDYLLAIQNADARTEHQKTERENSRLWKLRLKSRLFDPRKEDEVTEQELKELKDFGKKLCVFVAGVAVGTLFGISIAK